MTGLMATVVDSNVNITDISIKNIINTVLGYGVLDKYGKSIPEAHRLAVDVSAFVCTQNGAMPQAPADLVARAR